MEKSIRDRLSHRMLAGQEFSHIMVRVVILFGFILFLAGIIPFIIWTTGTEVTPTAYQIIWGSTNTVLLALVFGVYFRLKRGRGLTLLERVLLKLLAVSILAGVCLNLFVVISGAVKPITINGILLLVHFACFAVIPAYVSPVFTRISLLFLAGMLITAYSLIYSDLVYGAVWLLACLSLAGYFRKEGRTTE